MRNRDNHEGWKYKPIFNWSKKESLGRGEQMIEQQRKPYCIRRQLLHSHHTNTFTIRTNPGWPIADTPLIFLETFLTDHETTGTTPAKLFFLPAAVTDIDADLSFSVPSCPGFCRHCCTSPSTHWKYSSLPLTISCIIISGSS